MASKSGMFQASSGYAQQGGVYYITLSSIRDQFNTFVPGSGSGGSASVGSFTNFAYSGTFDQSTIIGNNKVIRDMGKTVVSAGRTFRKFQAVYNQTASTSGVGGIAATTTNPGYMTGYLEVADEGLGGDNALIVRYA